MTDRAPQSEVSHGPYLWEESKVLHYARAFFVENSDSQEGHAGSQVLEGQMEPSAFGQRPKTPNFCVHLHQPSPEINLGETLICCDGVHLMQSDQDRKDKFFICSSLKYWKN